MKTSLLLALFVAVCACAAVGCAKKDHQHPLPANTGSEVAQAGTNAPAGTIAACVLSDTALGTDKEVKPGTYCVCDEGTHEDHFKYKSPHLVKDQAAVIGPVDWVTPVNLGESEVLMIRSGDKSELSALVGFQHQNIATQQVENTTHLVRITNERNYQGQGCDKSNNIIKIAFCFQDEQAIWRCGAEPGGHLGDVHAQD